MSRGLVYPRAAARDREPGRGGGRGVGAGAGAEANREAPAPAAAPAGAGDGDASKRRADGYREKLVKYVPAEVIAFFVPITAALGTDDEGLVIACLIAGAIGALAF